MHHPDVCAIADLIRSEILRHAESDTHVNDMKENMLAMLDRICPPPKPEKQPAQGTFCLLTDRPKAGMKPVQRSPYAWHDAPWSDEIERAADRLLSTVGQLPSHSPSHKAIRLACVIKLLAKLASPNRGKGQELCSYPEVPARKIPELTAESPRALGKIAIEEPQSWDGMIRDIYVNLGDINQAW